MSVIKVNQIQTANGVIMANLNSSGANIGFQLTSTLAPAFSAYPAAALTIPNTTSTLLQVNTKTGSSQLFDTAGAFNNTGSTVTLNGLSVPAYAFMPPVAGYYLLGAMLSSNGTTLVCPQIAVNTTILTNTSFYSASGYFGGATSILTYLNGTSDYAQLYFYHQSSGSITTIASRPDLYKFFGHMVRSA